MTQYLLDSCICIHLIDGEPSVTKHLLRIDPSDVFLCSIVKAELIYGARHSGAIKKNLKTLAEFFEPFESITFDDSAAEAYGSIRAYLRKQGTPIGANDTLIAAIALSRDLTLVTRNTREFERVPNLNVVSW